MRHGGSGERDHATGLVPNEPDDMEVEHAFESEPWADEEREAAGDLQPVVTND